MKLGTRPRLGRVFRDEEELAASSDLSRGIDEALERAEALVVLCSERTPASRWVDAEVRRFAEMGRGNRILAVLFDGEPARSFPPALQALGFEPLAADLRALHVETARSVRRTGLLKLVAGLLGVEFDALRRRDEERRHRRLVKIAVAGGVLSVVLAGLTFGAVTQWQRAERELLVSRAQQLAAQAQIALAEASRGDSQLDTQAEAVRPDLQRSVLLALESLRLHPGLAGDRVLRAALFELAPDRLITELSEDEELAGVNTDGIILRAADGTSAAERPADTDLLATSRGGQLVMRRSKKETGGWIFARAEVQRAADGRRVALLPHEWEINKAAFTGDGRWVATVTGEASADAAEPSATVLVGSTVRVWEVVTGREVTRFSLAAQGAITDARIDEDGNWIATVTRRDTGKLVRLWPVSPDSLRRLACSVLQRNLSPSEWMTFVDEGPPQATCPGLPTTSE